MGERLRRNKLTAVLEGRSCYWGQVHPRRLETLAEVGGDELEDGGQVSLGGGQALHDGGQHGGRGGGVMQGGRARCGGILRWVDRAFGMQ